MKTFSGFKVVKEGLLDPQKEMKEMAPDHDIIFYQCDCGNCWYEARKEFSEDTFKVAYKEDGKVFQASKDASSISPENCSVTEIPMEEVPEDFSLLKQWRFIDGKLVRVEEDIQEEKESKRLALMRSATTKINELVAAEEDGDITEEEDVMLAKLRTYRATLRRMDLDKDEFPISPDKIEEE